MAKLYLQRHLKSQWNDENRFAGWADGPLSKEGADSAPLIAEKMKDCNFDVIYASLLIRNIQTVIKLMRHIDSKKYPLFIHLDKGKMKEWGNFVDITDNDIPTYVSEKLNERYYGKILQGLNKEEIIKKYGEEKVHLWRRSFTLAPPGGESGKDVYKRVIPFFKKYIEKDLKAGKNVLVVTSHNPLRVLVKYIEKVSDEKFGDLELPFGALLKYEFYDGSYAHLQ